MSHKCKISKDKEWLIVSSNFQKGRRLKNNKEMEIITKMNMLKLI